MSRCLAVLAVLFLAIAVHADNWPGWRGPTYDGVSSETNLPTTWSEDKNVAWKLKLPGRGGSTPCVWGDHIFLTSVDGNDVVLLCVSTSGKELWKRTLSSGGNARTRGDEGDPASPSPSTDGKHVWAMTGTGELACFDFDGKEIWKIEAQKRYGRFQYGFGGALHSTPLLYGDRLYLQLIHSTPAWVIALDKATGEEIWKIKRESDGHSECFHSYASATIWTDGTRSLLLSHGNDYCVAHDLKDGSEVWRLGDLNPKAKYNPTLRFVSSPVATPKLIIVPSAKQNQMVAVKPEATGKVNAGSKFEQWRFARTPDVCVPIYHDGLVYTVREGVVDCIDAATGEQLYSERVGQGKHRASPVLADGKLYVVARPGTIAVLKAGRKFEKLAANTLKDEFTASPAIANGRIYLRGFDSLYAISADGK